MSDVEIPKIKKIILSALMIAIYLILDRFLSIKTPILKISFIFIPIIISAIYLGPIYAGIIAGIRRFNRSSTISIWFIFYRVYNICCFNSE